MQDHSHQLLKPPEEPGKQKAMFLTLLVHGVLLVFLFFGVQWKQKDTVVEVELWSSVPKPATYVPEESEPEVKPVAKPEPKVEPKPEVKAPPKVEAKPVVKPDIALKDDKKKEPPKPEPPKPEPKKPEVKDPFKEALEREAKQLNAQKEERARTEKANQLAIAAATEQKAAGRASSLATYVGKIRAKVKGNISLPSLPQGSNPEAVFEINQLPTGEILSAKLTKSSGNGLLDEAIERAILKSSPLPKPDDPSLFQRVLEIRYRPFD